MNTQKKKRTLIVLACVLAFIVIALCTVLPCLYENGLLASAHPQIKAKDGQIRVACVGDSLTYGYGISHWTKNNYPVQLGNLLGDDYCVNNFGYSGHTVSSKGDRPYINTKLYNKSLAFAPNIVVIMLGSNDAKASNMQSKAELKSEYIKIIRSYLSLDSVKRVIIMSPTPVWQVKGKNPYGIQPSVVATDIHDMAKEISEDLQLEYIDLFAIFKDKAALFKDGAHPNAEGAGLIAQTVLQTING